jgi:hypothetical protein
MLANRIMALLFIFALAAGAWMYLGQTIVARTQKAYTNINSQVEGLCGDAITQRSPVVYDAANVPIDLRSSAINTKLDLEYRRKGLLWFPVYTVDFDGSYTVTNNAAKARPLTVKVPFPAEKGTLDNFEFTVNGNGDWKTGADWAEITLPLQPGQRATIVVRFKTRGLRTWRYAFDESVQHVRDFALTVTTNTPAINFPADTISPTKRDATSFTWQYANRLSGFQIGIEMPDKLNPGDVASRIAFFAPLGLLFFYIVLGASALIMRVNLHPMHFLFLAAGFFAFHLLFTYLVDHVSVFPSFLIASAASLLLVGDYLRLVAGPRFAILPGVFAQLVYLVLFSYAFFFKGYTGLTITIGAVLTLGVLMQLTGKVDWDAAFTRGNGKSAPPVAPPPVVSGEGG